MPGRQYSERCVAKPVKKITRAQLVHLTRRVLVLIAATFYVVVSCQAVVTSTFVLRGTTSSLTSYSTIEATLIAHYAGKTTIRESELLKVLGDATTPRNDSLYLESIASISFSGCAMPSFNAKLYSNAFLRSGFAGIQYGAYNLTFLGTHELIVPIVDCTFPLVVNNDVTGSRVYYLTRLKTDPEDVYIMTVSLSTQNYAVPDQHQEGAATVAAFSLINDVRVTEVQHHFSISLGNPYAELPTFEVYTFVQADSDGKWLLRSIPPNPILEAPKDVTTARRMGFYIKAEREQANFRNLHWRVFDKDPVMAMSVWEWQGRTVIRDAWAWVHYIHIFFAVNTLFHHSVLFLVIYQNARLGKIWVGDAFSSISNALLYRAVFVVVTWQIGGFWSISELCFVRGYELAGAASITFHPDIIHADLLALFLGSVGVLGLVAKERIDPALAVAVFEITLQGRLHLPLLDQHTKQYLIDYSIANLERGLVHISELLASKSPLRLWSLSELPAVSMGFIEATTGPNWAISFALMILFVLARKLHRRLHPEQLYSQKTMPKDKEPTSEAATTEKRTLTQFEIATGAERQNKFGVIVDYDNYVYFKGLKFASADGIYCNGFVIANGKFLLATEDIFVIILMKILRVRFRNVYIYDVDGSKLKQTARIVYPDTLTWSQLLHLNVSILA